MPDDPSKLKILTWSSRPDFTFLSGLSFLQGQAELIVGTTLLETIKAGLSFGRAVFIIGIHTDQERNLFHKAVEKIANNGMADDFPILVLDQNPSTPPHVHYVKISAASQPSVVRFIINNLGLANIDEDKPRPTFDLGLTEEKIQQNPNFKTLNLNGKSFSLPEPRNSFTKSQESLKKLAALDKEHIAIVLGQLAKRPLNDGQSFNDALLVVAEYVFKVFKVPCVFFRSVDNSVRLIRFDYKSKMVWEKKLSEGFALTDSLPQTLQSEVQNMLVKFSSGSLKFKRLNSSDCAVAYICDTSYNFKEEFFDIFFELCEKINGGQKP